MKATREQVAALAKEAANAAKIYIHEEGDAEFLERLVHLAQRFERDRLRAQGVIWVEAVPQCTHEYEIDSDHPNHSCCQNCGEILKDGVHVQPVAQEPFGIWHQGDTEEESDFFLFKDAGDVSCPNCIKLYTAPPDQSAEVSMTPAASIFKDEVARLNAEVERLRGNLHAMKQNALRDVERIAELARQRDVLAKLLCRYRNETPPGHQPHMIAHEVDAALASVKGNAEVTGVTTGENDAT